MHCFVSSRILSGLRYRLERDPLYPNAWTEVDYSPLNTNWSSTYLGIDEMYQYAKDPDIEAIVSVNPIVSYDAEAVRQFARDHPDIIVTLVAEELEQDQADLIEEGYVDAIVAEMPAEMGTMSAEILLRLNQQRPIPRPLYGRHMLELLRVPLLLPEANIDLHLLGNLQYLGVVLFGIVALYCFIVVGWINWNRKSATVISAQPPFLYMIVAGTLILASSIIPMAVDDDTFNDAKAMFESTEDIIQANATDDVTYSGIHFGEEGIKSGEETTTPADVACRVFPWLGKCYSSY